MIRKTWDEWQFIRDKEEIAEYVKAYEMAAQYRVNSDRIKRLLSFDPVTVMNGRAIVNNKNKSFLIAMRYDKRLDYINPILTSPV